MQADISYLIEKTGIIGPIVGLYDAPEPDAFQPLTAPATGKWACMFQFYKQWAKGYTLHLTADNYGCGGAGTWMFDRQVRTLQEYVEFLADDEGLKANHGLMADWINAAPRYKPEHGNLLIGPLKPELYEYLKTVTFFVNADELSMLMIAAQYFHSEGCPPAVIAPFGSGCMLMLGLFDDLDKPQAIVGASDLAMRKYLPRDIMAFTVTRPMYEQFAMLDKNSFLEKPFLTNLKIARNTRK